MPRVPANLPLHVLLNNRRVGLLLKNPNGAISFQYHEQWLTWNHALPISLSLPLREDKFLGDKVQAVFDNLLPDSLDIRRRVAEKVGAKGTDLYSLLYHIGRDCVGALQFLPENMDPPVASEKIAGEPLDEKSMEKLFDNLIRAPFGMGDDEEFRISVAGAQEKTALLYHKGQWWKPHGTTPTTHILKPQIGYLENGLDLSHSVENEYYCLKFLAEFGLPVAKAAIKVFGKKTVLAIERFDRLRTEEGRLLRLPQEDFCQALSVPSGLKYQNMGGPGIAECLELLKGSDNPTKDQMTFLKAQVLFWLLGATDGHAKNFSVFIGPGGRFQLTPIYDVLTAQPAFSTGKITRKQMKLAMFAGDNRHYRMDEIKGRHFIQTAQRAGVPAALGQQALDEVAQTASKAVAAVEKQLPQNFPAHIHSSVKKGVAERLRALGRH